MAVNGCDTGAQSVRLSAPEHGRFTDMWNTYTHCYRSEDLEAAHLDARRLHHAVGPINPAADSTLLLFDEPAHMEGPVRTSVDPAAMAAACALRAGPATHRLRNESAGADSHKDRPKTNKPGILRHTERKRHGIGGKSAIPSLASATEQTAGLLAYSLLCSTHFLRRQALNPSLLIVACRAQRRARG